MRATRGTQSHTPCEAHQSLFFSPRLPACLSAVHTAMPTKHPQFTRHTRTRACDDFPPNTAPAYRHNFSWEAGGTRAKHVFDIDRPSPQDRQTFLKRCHPNHRTMLSLRTWRARLKGKAPSSHRLTCEHVERHLGSTGNKLRKHWEQIQPNPTIKNHASPGVSRPSPTIIHPDTKNSSVPSRSNEQDTPKNSHKKS